MVGLPQFCDAISSFIAAANELDAIKKALFYGKVSVDIAPYPEGPFCDDLPLASLARDETNEQHGIDAVHAILGIATEAGELMEALNIGLFGNDLFDTVNAAEELGDVFWYAAILANAAGSSFEEIQAKNIAKLRARFPDKFTEYDANNRNLGAERAILESDNASIVLEGIERAISTTQLAQACITPIAMKIDEKGFIAGFGIEEGKPDIVFDAAKVSKIRSSNGAFELDMLTGTITINGQASGGWKLLTED